MLEAVLLPARTSPKSNDRSEHGSRRLRRPQYRQPSRAPLSWRLVQLHLQAELSTGNAAQASRAAAKAKKSAGELHGELQVDCEVSSGACTVHVDSQISLHEKEAGAVALASRAQVTSRECIDGKKSRPTANAERLLLCVALVFETVA